MNPPLPPNEGERLAALLRYAILDTPYEVAFDRITALAARIFKVPISQITLVDEGRQWFKSSFGSSLRETARDVSFCAHAILDDTVMVVPDATLDPRFQDNPLVTADAGVRFYAGVPLKVSGNHNLGTLCVIDHVAREFSREQEELLAELAAIATDALELRNATRENRRLAAAISNVETGVVMSDPEKPDNPIVFANPAFAKITGYEMEDILGRNCRFLQGPQTDAAVLKQMREAIKSRVPFHGVLLNHRKDGSPFWNELTITPVFDPSGKLINFVGIQHDISERRKLEHMRDSLTHMIIHDLRNPLTTTLGFLELLKKGTADKLTGEEMEWIEIALEGAGTLNELVTTLLDINRLEAGEMPLNIGKCDLSALVFNATQSMRILVGEARLLLDLPSVPVVADCDASVIRRVVNNLVGNALKFTPEGGEVRVTVEALDSTAIVTVSDDGPGIPKEHHAMIFEKFGQVAGHRTQNSTGLGLTFCKLALEAHRGTICVRSEPGEGSAFSFAFPLRSRNGAS